MTTFTVTTAAQWMLRSAELMDEHASALTELDAAIGDADHGANMKRGFAAVREIVEADGPDGSGSLSSSAALLKKAGMTLVSKVGGSAGPLYGTLFLRLAGALGDDDADTTGLAAALRAGVEGLAQRGKSEAGEKTMLDAWIPAVAAFEQAGDDLSDAVTAGAKAAARGRDETEPMIATKGRASYLGERSAGHIDPGAASSALLWQALQDVVAGGAR